MRKSWIAVAGIGVFAVVLAFVLLPKPDTGGDIPDRPRGGRTAVGSGADGADVAVGARPIVRPGLTERVGSPRTPREPGVRAAGSKGAVEHPAEATDRRRSEPDAVAAGQAAAPWSQLRRQMLMSEDPAAKDMLDESAKIIQDLRELRRDPESQDFDDLETRQKNLARRVRNSSLIKDPLVQDSLTRIDEIYDTYHRTIAKQNQ